MANENASKHPAGKSTQGNGEIQEMTPFQRMVRKMAGIATMDAEEAAFQGDDLNGILIADSLEEMWDADERPPLNFQHLTDCHLEILEVSVKYSRPGSEIETPFRIRQDDGTIKKMFLLVTAQRISKSGEKKVINLPKPYEVFIANTSARFIVAKLMRAMELGAIDPVSGARLRCWVKEIDLGGGQSVLKLRPLEDSSVPVTAA